MDNALDLVFAAVYQKSLSRQLDFIAQVLTKLKERFLSLHSETVGSNPFTPIDFAEDFAEVRKEVEDRIRQKLAAPKPKQMKSFSQTEKSKKTLQYNKDFQSGKIQKDKAAAAAEAAAASASDEEDDSSVAETKEQRMARNIAKMKVSKAAGNRGGAGVGSPTKKQLQKAKRKDKLSESGGGGVRALLCGRCVGWGWRGWE
jgi:hypothetical protein